MKKLIIFIVFLIISANVFAQNPTYQEKLYYTCKVWGFVKYFHSKVSICEVNWDSVLVSTLPVIKNAVTVPEFNDALYSMLQAAGPMDIATTPSPDTLPPELKRNLKLGWINDPIFRSDVKEILDTIKNNFSPHPICWVKHTNGTGNWLGFPHDDPIIDTNLSANYPNEVTRLMLIFRYWNILNYFNPNNYILDTPWDSTLYKNVLTIANAPTFTDFFRTFKKMTAALDDAHVEVLTNSFLAYYSPKLVLRYSFGNYIVVKSRYPEIAVGDIVESVDDKTTIQWEDSLSPYTSAGNPSVFRRFMSSNLLRGTQGSVAKIGYKDSLGITKSLSTTRDSVYYSYWFQYYPNATLGTVKWKKFECNVGYVNIDILESWDVTAMYNDLYNTKAIIFDIRNYPNVSPDVIAPLLYQKRMCFAKLTEPDVFYPGTYSWSESWLGYDGNNIYYKGKIIILCNQETQSAAEYTCMALRAMPNSVVVGSQTAGADGNVTMFKIAQDIQTGFTFLSVYYPDGTQTQRIGIVPDSIVYPTAEGIRQGRDEVLEKALDIAGCVVSVDEKENAKGEITVYPNPADDFIFISSVTGHIKIYDIMGREVWKGKSVTEINTSNWLPGCYVVTGLNKAGLFIKH